MLGMKEFEAKSKDDILSYYQIAGKWPFKSSI